MLPIICAVALHSHADARLGKGFRQDRSGWVYAHLEGSPKEIGFQYGSLLAPEIDDAQRALQAELKAHTGKDWTYYRETTQKLFWPKVDEEYRQEIEGQAEGLQSKGFHYDQWDVLAFNGFIEISGYYLPWTQNRPSSGQSCSAFIATGSETSDGKIVMAQNFWWDYWMGERFNAMLDIIPKNGHRILMDALPGLIDSATDFAINDAGILVTETTLPNLNDFDPNGVPEFVRMRKATQYASSLDEFVKIMKDGNNGGYPNTWLIGDTNTNEIGKLELGLKNVSFERTKDGYFVGSNFPQNPALISQETPGWDANPLTNGCEARRKRWDHLLDQNKGKVDASLAQKMLADTVDYRSGKPSHSLFAICGETDDWGANNAKVVTTKLASTMSLWGRMGFPDGTTMPIQKESSPFVKDLASHPWTLFTAQDKDQATAAGSHS